MTAIAGPDAVHLIPGRPTRGRDLTTVAEFELDAGDEVPFVLTWYPSHEPVPTPVDGIAATARHDRVVGGVVGALARRRAPPQTSSSAA